MTERTASHNTTPDPFAEPTPVDAPTEIDWHDVLNYPGALSASRIPLGLATAYFIHREWYGAAAVTIGIAGWTDNKDGREARARGLETAGGAIADPLCDRVFEIMTVAALTAKGLLSKKLGTAVIASEVAALAGAGYILHKTGDARNVQPTKEGKVGAAITFIGGAALAASGAVPETLRQPLSATGKGLMAAGLGVGLFGRARLLLRNQGREQHTRHLALMNRAPTVIGEPTSLA